MQPALLRINEQGIPIPGIMEAGKHMVHLPAAGAMVIFWVMDYTNRLMVVLPGFQLLLLQEEIPEHLQQIFNWYGMLLMMYPQMIHWKKYIRPRIMRSTAA